MKNRPDRIFSQNLRVLTGYAPSVSEICRRAGINRPQFHRYLAGEGMPSLRSLSRICDYFGVEENEILMAPSEFKAIIRLRPPKLARSHDPLRDVQRRMMTGEDFSRVGMGYYHVVFRPDAVDRIFYRALLRMTPANEGILIKMVERYPRPALALPMRLVSEGSAYVRSGKLYCLMQETRMRRSTWFLVLSIGDFVASRVLHGLASGTGPEGTVGIMSFPVVWIALGESPDLRKALRACGYFRREEIDISPEVDAALERSGLLIA